MKKLLLILMFATLLLNKPILAGSRDGPNVVLFNLERNQNHVSELIEGYINESAFACDGVLVRNPYFYINSIPKEFSKEIIYSTFVRKNEKSKSKLENFLIAFEDNEHWSHDFPSEAKGLDGIIVYSSTPKPRFMSLTTPRVYKKKIKTYYIKNIDDEKSIIRAFCDAVPPITRAP